MCIIVYVYMYICIYVYMCTHIYIYMYCVCYTHYLFSIYTHTGGKIAISGMHVITFPLVQGVPAGLSS